jgi:hypothetical protein
MIEVQSSEVSMITMRGSETQLRFPDRGNGEHTKSKAANTEKQGMLTVFPSTGETGKH